MRKRCRSGRESATQSHGQGAAGQPGDLGTWDDPWPHLLPPPWVAFFASQVSALRGNVQRSGSGGVMWSRCFSRCQKLFHFGSWCINRVLNTAGAATSFLQSGFLCRLGMLLPAGHTWLKIRQMSVLIPYSVRVALIGMKVISAAAMGALFFSSSAPTPDSDPDCTPPEATRLKRNR